MFFKNNRKIIAGKFGSLFFFLPSPSLSGSACEASLRPEKRPHVPSQCAR